MLDSSYARGSDGGGGTEESTLEGAAGRARPSSARGVVSSTTRLTPFGFMVSAVGAGARMPFSSSAPLLAWVSSHRVVVLRGFRPLAGDELREVGFALARGERGGVGRILEGDLCVRREFELFLDQEVPLHRDLVGSEKPRYVVFQCITAPPAGCGGETLFSDTTRCSLTSTHRQLYDPAVCYPHRWCDGDVLVADNLALLHGRAPFPRCARRALRRVTVM